MSFETNFRLPEGYVEGGDLKLSPALVRTVCSSRDTGFSQLYIPEVGLYILYMVLNIGTLPCVCPVYFIMGNSRERCPPSLRLASRAEATPCRWRWVPQARPWTTRQPVSGTAAAGSDRR